MLHESHECQHLVVFYLLFEREAKAEKSHIAIIVIQYFVDAVRTRLVLPNGNGLLHGHLCLNLRHDRELFVAFLVAQDQERLLNFQFLILVELAWVAEAKVVFVLSARLEVLNRRDKLHLIGPVGEHSVQSLSFEDSENIG